MQSSLRFMLWWMIMPVASWYTFVIKARSWLKPIDCG